MERNSQEFDRRVAQALRSTGVSAAWADPAEDSPDGALYGYLRRHVREHQLFQSCIALELVRGIMTDEIDRMQCRLSGKRTCLAYYHHCLSVCRMLIDLHTAQGSEEEDVLLAAALCHILPECIQFSDLRRTLTEQYGLETAIVEIIQLIFREENGSEADQVRFYGNIRQNRLALMIKLADRGNLVEQLYGISGWDARSYIHETKAHFFPMCIYAKEHYPELLAPVSVLMEKMRCLTEVAEILLGRYEQREAELSQEILELQEDNAALKRRIERLRAD